jgi:hypothetical protein
LGVDETGSSATYCSGTGNIGATNAGIGWGDTNTALAKSFCMGGAVAKVNSFNASNNTGYSDWFIPSSNELTELVKVRNQAGLLRLSTAWNVGQWGYWGSTEVNSAVMATLVTDNNQWSLGNTTKTDATHNLVRPVRQFTPCWAVDSCTALSSTTRPSQAGGYAITPAGYSLSVGSLSNYEGITYRSTTVTINRAAQSAQAIPYYSPSYPETMTVYTGGGSGTGAQSFTVLAGGTANSCAFDFRKLTTNGAGTCNIQVVKQGDRNYLPDTATAYIYILAFALNQPSSAVGSGPGIALGGINTVTLDSTTAPTITAVTWVTNHWEISGAGFGALGNSNTVVKFWRNKPVIWDGGLNTTNYVASDTLIYITNVPVGATTGKIMVITANGIAVSTDNWIAP